jgi:HK97 family phage prohead protease
MIKFDKSVSGAIAATDTGGFRGYAARFLNIDRQGDIILPGAFAKALPAFMDDGGLVLADHSNTTGAVIGTLIDAAEDNNGLIVDVQFSATKSGQEVRQLMAERALRKMSISFFGKSMNYNQKQIEEVWSTYGYKPSDMQRKNAARGAKVITDVSEILEVSVVPIPANADASILAVKSFDEPVESPNVAVYPQIDLRSLLERSNLADRVLSR